MDIEITNSNSMIIVDLTKPLPHRLVDLLNQQKKGNTHCYYPILYKKPHIKPTLLILRRRSFHYFYLLLEYHRPCLEVIN